MPLPRPRAAITIIEVFVVTSLVGILVGILLVAIGRARMAADRLASNNNIRQIVLAWHNAASTTDRLPNVEGDFPYRTSPLVVALKFAPSRPHPVNAKRGGRLLLCNPADQTFAAGGALSEASSSYVVNAVALGRSRRASDVRDGTSSTIGLAERYARCGRMDFTHSLTGMRFTLPDGQPYIRDEDWGQHRATLADPLTGNARPVTVNGQTRSSRPGMTFQLAPPLDECQWRMPQSPFPDGMSVAYLDGSVRVVAPSVGESVFWSSVTHDGREAGAD